VKTESFRNVVRDRGYEALFLLTGLVSLSLRPSLKHAIDLEFEIGGEILRRRDLDRLKRNGLVESGGGTGDRVVRLTRLGQLALEGGRHPEEAWNRGWDGQWRLVLFDLPRDAGLARTSFWRWLRSNYFGRLQGSVWIGPDPVPELSEAAGASGLDPSNFVLVTGQVDDARPPRQLAAEAWDLQAVDKAYALYLEFAEKALRQIGRGVLSRASRQEILHDDRTLWWGAVRIDPLLPKEILPKSYLGMRAWKLRQKLHATLMQKLAARPPGEP
jgi:phenylacetic acid degradation operon negative regulatory protein